MHIKILFTRWWCWWTGGGGGGGGGSGGVWIAVSVRLSALDIQAHGS